MHVKALRSFFEEQIEDAKQKGLLLSLHLKATMMKVSDPVMFGHAVSVFFKDVFEKHAATFSAAGREPELRPGRPLREDPGPAGRQEGGDRGRHQGRLRDPSGAGDGRLGQGHHQPPRPERHHRRRVDAGRRPRVGQDVGPRRQAARHQGDDPGSLLRHDLQDHHRGLPAARRLRPGDHGQRAERRPDGAEGRGVRLARQDVHRRRRRAPSASSTRPPARRCSSRRSRRATSSARARPRTSPSATG